MAGFRASTSLSLLCFIAIICCFSTASSSSDASEAGYNVLTLTWPGAKCQQTACCLPTAYDKPARDFFVEALVPYSNITNNLVTNCNPERFYVNQLWAFIEDLNTHWPDVSCPCNNNVGIWNSTWLTYGNCAIEEQKTYFNLTLQLRNKTDPLAILATNGIVPSKETTYKRDGIETALQANFTNSYYIECNSESELYKIHFCVSADATQLIDCPIRKDSIPCPAEVRFPPFDLGQLRPCLKNVIRMPTAGDVDK